MVTCWEPYAMLKKKNHFKHNKIFREKQTEAVCPIFSVPLLLDSKNYLFAGSHDAAKRAASIYSFFAMCRKEEVNPFEWLRHVFANIMDTKVTELHTLYPQYYKLHIAN